MNVVFFDLNVFETIKKGGAVVEDRVDNDGSGERKGDKIGDGVGCGEVEVAIVFVCGFVEVMGPDVDDTRDVVKLAEAIERTVRGNREVGEIPGLRV